MTSLADLQRAPDAEPVAGPAELALDVDAVRTFDTPEFAGMTFLEVTAKSALNRVRGMPFPWSINPYRGCSHACSYCLVGDTRVLMADGTARPIADLRPGDAVVGTARSGAYRRYVASEVHDHWTTRKPAYRVRLSDGSTLIASGDHRLLTHRGWKHVTGSDQGRHRRPHLTTNDVLHSVGSGPEPPKETAHYSPKWTVLGSALKGTASVHVVAVEPLGLELEMFDITTRTGDFIAGGLVNHNCFARPTHRYLNMSPLGDFDRKVVVKTNVVEVLRRELAKPSWKGEQVALGTNTDPYQRAEGRYRLMPGIIAALARSWTPFSILTKGSLVTRDILALQAAAERVPVAAALTIGMLDEDLWRVAEPGTPSPRARLDAVRRLNQDGNPTGYMLAPIMPGLNDDHERLAALVEEAARAGARHITPIVLHLRRDVRTVFWPWLEQEHPELVGRYEELYPAGRRGGEAVKEYRDELLGFVRARRDAAWRRHGRPAPPPGWRGPDGARRSPVTADPVAAEIDTGHPPPGGAPRPAPNGQLSLL